MNRRVALLALVLTLVALFALAPAALAYNVVVGCTFAGTSGDSLGPWTHGGTATAVQTGTGYPYGSADLDANGCFSINTGNGPKLTVTIVFDPGPNGTPADQTCSVPADPNYPPTPQYTCSDIFTSTGPNAVSLSQFSGNGLAAGWLVAPLAAVAATALLWLRRR